MPCPTREEIDAYYKDWWRENYMQPLNKTPMGLIDFLLDFHAKYCEQPAEVDNPGLTD
jgi:hypothetical protein